MRPVLIPCAFCGCDLADVLITEFESVAGEIACHDCAATLTALAIAIAKGEQRYTEFPLFTAGEQPTLQRLPLMPPPRRSTWQRFADYWRRWIAWYQEGH